MGRESLRFEGEIASGNAVVGALTVVKLCYSMLKRGKSDHHGATNTPGKLAL